MLHNITFEDTSIVSQANWKNNWNLYNRNCDNIRCYICWVFLYGAKRYKKRSEKI